MVRTSENAAYETVRKASEALAALPWRTPKRSCWVHFGLRIPAIFTVGAFLVPLFGQFLMEGSRKSGPAVPSEARGARVGRTAQNSTHPIYLSVDAPPPVPQYHRRHPNGRRQ